MKKFFTMAMVAIMGLSLLSCNQKGGSATSNVSAAMKDSVSTAFGDFAGSIFNFQSAQDSTLNKEAFLRGMNAVLNSDTAKSYQAGMQVAMQMMQEIDRMQKEGIGFDKAKFMQHFKKAFMADSAVSEMALQQMQTEYTGLMSRAASEAKKNDPEAIKHKKAGEAFVNKKAAEPGYIKTKSGIVYKVIAPGAGENFKDGDAIMTKYKGTHIDGKVFDESKEAVPFKTNGVIPGFAEVLKLMKPGSKVEVIIPGDQAYGDEGQRNPMTGEYTIYPNETLVFELETVGLQKPEDAKKPQMPTR